MRPKVRKVLDVIDGVLAEGCRVGETGELLMPPDTYIDAADLWNILTALRGPDSCDCDLKQQTTAIIRAHAFPKAAAGMHRVLAFVNSVDTTIVCDDCHHFESHVWEAARALGIPITPPPAEEPSNA